MPPERMKVPKVEPAPPCDVYSFGKLIFDDIFDILAIVFWELLTRREPFKTYQEQNDRAAFKRAILDVIKYLF